MSRGGVAIIGMACRFPGGATTPARFWDLLCAGTDAVTEAPPERLDPALFDPDPGRPGTVYSRWGGFMEDIDAFDAEFFGISPREARRMDPQQRLLLELAWEALEDGGQRVDRLAGSATGVFVGLSGHDYADLQSRPDQRALIDVHVNAGSASSVAANRISHALDLRGPSVVVDTACSSALTALHLACTSLAAGESEVAVVGAANALLTPEPTIGFCRAGMLSPTGRCRPFAAGADGYVRSEGAAVVVVKPLDQAVADGDPVHAVILATGVNQDGRTPGLTVPSSAAQRALIERVLGQAGLTPGDVHYVEAHGTGTAAGDPREARAVGAVMAGRPADRPCLIGSAKGNVGHLEAAAGMVGLVKAALAVRHRTVPPSLHFDAPHPDIDFAGLRLRVPTALERWPDGVPAVAGVNAFGFGGTNAHVVLAEPPPATVPAAPERAVVLPLSARSPEALRDLASAWVGHLGASPDPVADLCATAAARRTHHEHRVAVVGRSAADLAGALGDVVARRCPAEPPRLAFVFSGMGAPWCGTGAGLLDEPVFATAVAGVDELLVPLAGWSLAGALAAGAADPEAAGPAGIHAAHLGLQVALAALWRSWGVVPDAVAGHSSGEVAAACVAGALDLGDALRVAYHRGRLQRRLAGSGGMLAAGVGTAEAAALLDDLDGVVVAAHNGPASVTFSGDERGLAVVAARLMAAGRFHRRLPVTVPYHGPQLGGLGPELLESLDGLAATAPAVPLASTVTGRWLDERPGPAHWWDNVRRPVRFADAAALLAGAGCGLVVEVGSHPVLAPALAECLGDGPLASLRRGEDERATMLRALAHLYTAGRPIDWDAVGGRRPCADLPRYPWQRRRHWLVPAPAAPTRPAVHEVDLATARFAFLDGHRVDGTVTFPAAGYVDLLLTTAGGAALEGVELHRLLALGDGRPAALRCSMDGDALRVESRAEGGWTLRATARVAPARPPEPPVDLGAVRARCRPVDVEVAYATLAEDHGLGYSGAFRSVEAMWRGDGEALGRVALPDGLDATGWAVQPALLDGALQVLAAAVAAPAAGPLLPVGMARVDRYGAPGRRCWSHVTVTRRDGGDAEAVVRLVDDGGAVLVRCEGLVVRAVGRDGGDLVREERWVPAPGPAVAAAEAVSDAADRLGMAAYYDTVGPALDAFARRAAADALDAAAVAPRHQRFAARLRDLAAGAGPAPDLDEVAAAHPGFRHAAALVAESGRRLAATLRGDDDAREWLLAGPWLPALAGLYAGDPGFAVYAAGAAAAVAAAGGGARLRVLEVGAGTGGATGPVLEALGDRPVDYLATDVSPWFVRSLRERFGDRPGFRAEVLDVEAAGPPSEPWDVVLAADVVHATADAGRTLRALRSLLRPGGLLVLVEAVDRAPWLDLVFGQLHGWWRHAGDPARPDHPLLDGPAWVRLLEDAGFEGAAAVTDGARHPLQAVLVAATPAPAGARRWLVCTDGTGVGPEVAAGLRQRGDKVALAWPGPGYRRYGEDGFELVADDAAHWERLLADAGPVDGLVHLWALDAAPDPPAAASAACGSVAALFRAAGSGAVGRLWLVTAGAQPAAGSPSAVATGQAALWGLGRVVRTERGGERCRLVDLGAGCPPADVAALVDLLGDAGAEPEVALRDGRRLVPRLGPAALAEPEPATEERSPATDSFRVQVARPGALESLGLRPCDAAPPGPGQVAVRVRAGALNFRDVLVALGLAFAASGEDPATAPLGWECAGVVEACGEGVHHVRPGDEVVAMAAGALGSRVVTRAAYVVGKPPALSFEEAATLPVAFLTARYALLDLARLSAGERVLVHSAAGGVGLAAVQVARRAGAEVLATAGSPAKRAYLESLGIEHVMDSRSTAFADEVVRLGGVDVVLNSLAGEAASRGLDVLRPWGRFVEIGKRDIHEGGRLDLAPFRANLSYLALDLHPMYEERPEVVASMLRELVDDAARGAVEPLPYSAFDLAEAEAGFRLMAQGGHIGKLVLSAGRPSYPVAADRPLFRSDGTYVVTGGLGGFGLAVARWMADQGAGRLVLVGRRGAPRPEDAAALDALRASPAEVVVERADVTDAAALAGVLDRARAAGPLRGVVHAAMVLDDALLGTLDRARLEAVLAPKVAGAWNLHTLTAGDRLDCFVLFSSISAVVGQPAQANYAAGNAVLDALAAHRRALGLPATAVEWGVVEGVGYVARNPDLRRRMRRQGLAGLAVEEACAVLGRVLRSGPARVVVSRGRWGAATAAPGRPASGPGRAATATRRPATPAEAERYLLAAAARVMEGDGDRLDVDRPLFELGFDSLMAVELRTAIRADVGVEVPIADLLDGLTIRRLAALVAAGADDG